MIRLLIILLILSGKTFGQDYVINWSNGVPREPGIINYQIQSSPNNVTFTTLPNATIAPRKRVDTNKYSFLLPVPVSFYWVRIKTLFSNSPVYTVSKKIVNTNVSITNALYRNNPSSDNLSFTATNEAQAEYYSIDRSNNGLTWTVAGKLLQTNRRNYVLNVSKNGPNRRYRLKVVYKNGIVSPYTSFVNPN